MRNDTSAAEDGSGIGYSIFFTSDACALTRFRAESKTRMIPATTRRTGQRLSAVERASSEMR